MGALVGMLLGSKLGELVAPDTVGNKVTGELLGLTVGVVVLGE
jgi:hypothetical protein